MQRPVTPSRHTHRAWDPAEGSDLRRRRRGEWVDQILNRAEWLPAADRVLVEAVFRDGRSAAELARLTGDEPRTVRRRIKRTVERALSARLAFVVAQRASWAPTRRRVAEAIVVQGNSMREASRRLGLSYHTVRRHADAIDALYRATQHEPRGNGRAWR